MYFFSILRVKKCILFQLLFFILRKLVFRFGDGMNNEALTPILCAY